MKPEHKPSVERGRQVLDEYLHDINAREKDFDSLGQLITMAKLAQIPLYIAHMQATESEEALREALAEFNRDVCSLNMLMG